MKKVVACIAVCVASIMLVSVGVALCNPVQKYTLDEKRVGDFDYSYTVIFNTVPDCAVIEVEYEVGYYNILGELIKTERRNVNGKEQAWIYRIERSEVIKKTPTTINIDIIEMKVDDTLSKSIGIIITVCGSIGLAFCAFMIIKKTVKLLKERRDDRKWEREAHNDYEGRKTY